MTTRNWYQQGNFEQLPIELSLEILSFIHPVYPTIHLELERLNRTMPNMEKYYLGDRLLPQDGDEDPYDPNTNYQVALTIDNFVLLGQLVVLNRLLMEPIKLTSKRKGVGMQWKHTLESILHDTYPNYLRYNYTIEKPINIRTSMMYVSREMAILSLYVCGWNFNIQGQAHINEWGEQRVNECYYKFFVREVALTKKRISRHPDFIPIRG
jgi:hypothetical protein